MNGSFEQLHPRGDRGRRAAHVGAAQKDTLPADPASASLSASGVIEKAPGRPLEGPLTWRDNNDDLVFDSNHPGVQAGKIAGKASVDGTVFTRRRDGVHPGAPYEMRFQVNRPLTDDEVRHFAGLVGYCYRSTVAGEPLWDPVRDTPCSFTVCADTTKSRRDDHGMALEEFERGLPGLIRDGSPVRKTDRSGPGTKGTRLIDGFGDPGLKCETFYDDVYEDQTRTSLQRRAGQGTVA